MQRKLLTALPLLMTASVLTMPAYAQSTGQDDSAEMRQVARQFNDPAMQKDISNAAEALTNVMLDLPVGKFAEAIERARPGTVDEHINRDTRLGDLAGPDADRMPARVGNTARASMAAVGGMMDAFADMLPEFRKLARDIEASVEDARQRH